MKNNLCILGLLFLLPLITLCTKKEENTPNSKEIFGVWTNMKRLNDTVIVFERVNTIQPNNYSIKFESTGEFIERSNAAKCGSSIPPAPYVDYKGKWTISKSMLNITVPFWGGEKRCIWHILTVDENNLRILKQSEKLEHK